MLARNSSNTLSPLLTAGTRQVWHPARKFQLQKREFGGGGTSRFRNRKNQLKKKIVRKLVARIMESYVGTGDF